MTITDKLKFAKTISGIFSNREQALKNPRKFANINIYFLPLSWEYFKCHAFYSEQSYDHSPWRPYRQSINKLSYQNNTFIIDNYKIENQMRYSGVGSDVNLLKDIYKEKLIEKKGCSMHFKETIPDSYTGNIKPGNNCCSSNRGTSIYILSQIKINKSSWISEDSAYNKETDKKIWGSKYGPLEFKKISSYNKFIDDNWSARL